ncbi:MAG TPA: c-type cytochrome [Polyangia bacterium]|jgi:Cytochrome c.|nr:c-type cytochrome [Polyangia bacterium]
MRKTIAIVGSGLLVMCFSAASMAGAPETFAQKCAGCHGKDGKGQTAMGKKLSIKDLTDAKVQAATKDDAWEKSITDGVKNDAGKVVMPANKGKITPEDIKALVKVCREFKGK